MCGEMKIFARTANHRREIAALCDGRLMEYIQEDAGAVSLVGTVLLGSVERVLPPVGAAFIKIGQPLNGFLPLTEKESFERNDSRAPLRTGTEVLVQVKKDAQGEKGAFLTRDIALPGLYCIYMPLNRHVGVSGRVKNEEDREKLAALGRELAAEGGMIMRHAALGTKPEEITEELEGLRALWQEIVKKAAHSKPPAVLYQEPSAFSALLRDDAARYHLSVLADSEAYRAELPTANTPFDLQSDIEMEALWQGAGIARQLTEALGRQVQLKGGGTLVIDEREALTTIDVNTARRVGTECEQGLGFVQNMEACEEVARQIRLRNLSGILLIDFIDMESDQEREQVQNALGEALAKDRTKTVLHGFTRLGLFEMTRKRTRESLSQLLTVPCTVCRETGRSARKDRKH